MCSPSRASFFTGTFLSRRGVTLTLTLGDLWPDPPNIPDVRPQPGRQAHRSRSQADAERERRRLHERLGAALETGTVAPPLPPVD